MKNILAEATNYVATMKPEQKVIGEQILCKAYDLGFQDKDSMLSFEREVWGLMACKFNMIEFPNMGLGKMVHIISIKS